LDWITLNYAAFLSPQEPPCITQLSSSSLEFNFNFNAKVSSD